MNKLLAFAALVALPATVSAATLSEGLAAYQQNKVAEAERIFTEVAADPQKEASDRSRAARELARIAWLIEGNADAALAHLQSSARIGNAPCDTGNLMLRILRESGRYAEVLERGGPALQACKDQSKRDLLRIHLIKAMLHLAMVEPARRTSLLDRAAAEVASFDPQGSLETARARLETAVLRNDPAAALAAWRDYFWLEEGDAPQALEGRDVAALFAAGLRPTASSEDRLSFANLLMRVGFSDAARLYADIHRLPQTVPGHPTWQRLQAYWQQRKRLEETLLRVNRGFARGRSDETTLAKVQNEVAAALVAAAGGSGDPKAVLLEHYGLFGTSPGKTSGYPSVHLGHVAEDRRDRVLQYGRSADIRFIALDNMIANGFPTWLADAPAVGGWATDGVIVQVRQSYVEEPTGAAALVGDSTYRRDLLARQPKLAAEDLAKLRARPVATLHGLRDRITMQLLDRIEAAARSKGGGDLRRAFLAEYWRAAYNNSMQIHEGRHAIDYTLGMDESDQFPLEYRAKLSQLALADYPRMSLNNINQNLEGEDAHSRAGARVFDEYRQWIEANKAQVLGYDPALPALVQLDKLTDNQIREIARGLDPLAVAQNTTASGGAARSSR